MNPEFTIYGFSQVLEATGNFSDDNKLGQGGFGPVYKVHSIAYSRVYSKRQNVDIQLSISFNYVTI